MAPASRERRRPCRRGRGGRPHPAVRDAETTDTTKSETTMKKILSMDGGAVRAIIQGRVLSEIEKRTNTPCALLFDLIAGTSSGGNLAMGLVMPDEHGRPKYPATEASISYKANTPRIFSRSFSQRINPFSSLLQEKYSSDVARDVYKTYYGESRLSQALTPVVITAYEIERGMAYFFKSEEAKRDPRHDFYMRDVVLATTAAPTFFEPARVQNVSLADTFYFVDGGVYANNPAMIALVEARRMFPDEGEFLLVSLGSGSLSHALKCEQVKGWGVAQWARPILNVVFDGIADAVDYQLWHLLPMMGQGNGYYRFQSVLTEATGAFDNTSEAHFERLEKLGQDLIEANEEKLAQICARLVL
jgi:predicted acylesterase/phospholipase RssA